MRISFHLILFCFFHLYCSSIGFGNEAENSNGPKPSKFFYPAGESEKVIDEKGKEVKISDLDPPEFQRESTDPSEIFRVYLTGDGYSVRQIRNSDVMRRKPDPGGDALIIDEIKKFDGRVDFRDDGMVLAKMNARTGKLENVNFHTRVPKINDLAKIIQNDSTRWVMVHKNEEPVLTKYLVMYYIHLRGNASKDQVKEELKGEVRK
ncbi:MAG: hypothetical protein H7A24_02370 [Leptospiraceae bacterium]|nr:hypothetical protein [Leptospiraceae bacterium]MCP5510695.1 hypothetical protein [Leptospiraceae bacterium]